MFLCGSENQFSEAKVLLLTKVGVRLLKFFLKFLPKNFGFLVEILTWSRHSTKYRSQIDSFFEEIRLFWSRMRIIFDEYNFRVE